ncbi:MAG: hypothetical protein LW698_06440 [Planctomycetaceae bacterium]|nr:hypothetical protein [Planctomycetaceae bacterium]
MGVALGGLTRLEPESAADLAKLKSMQGMLLPDLEELDSVPLAARLAKQDHVFLPRLKRLSPEIARALSANEGGRAGVAGARGPAARRSRHPRRFDSLRHHPAPPRSNRSRRRRWPVTMGR